MIRVFEEDQARGAEGADECVVVGLDVDVCVVDGVEGVEGVEAHWFASIIGWSEYYNYDESLGCEGSRVNEWIYLVGNPGPVRGNTKQQESGSPYHQSDSRGSSHYSRSPSDSVRNTTSLNRR